MRLHNPTTTNRIYHHHNNNPSHQTQFNHHHTHHASIRWWSWPTFWASSPSSPSRSPASTTSSRVRAYVLCSLVLCVYIYICRCACVRGAWVCAKRTPHPPHHHTTIPIHTYRLTGHPSPYSSTTPPTTNTTPGSRAPRRVRQALSPQTHRTTTHTPPHTHTPHPPHNTQINKQPRPSTSSASFSP